MNTEQWDRLAKLSSLPPMDLTALKNSFDALAATLARATASFNDVTTEVLAARIDKLQKDATAALGRGDKRHYRQAMRDLADARRALEWSENP